MAKWRDVAEPGNTVSTPHFLSSARLLEQEEGSTA